MDDTVTARGSTRGYGSLESWHIAMCVAYQADAHGAASLARPHPHPMALSSAPEVSAGIVARVSAAVKTRQPASVTVPLDDRIALLDVNTRMAHGEVPVGGGPAHFSLAQTLTQFEQD